MISWSAKRVSAKVITHVGTRHLAVLSPPSVSAFQLTLLGQGQGLGTAAGQVQGSDAIGGWGARRLPRPSGRPPSWTSMCGAWLKRGSTRVSGSIQGDAISRPLPGGQLVAVACLFIPHIAAALKSDIAETERCSILEGCRLLKSAKFSQDGIPVRRYQGQSALFDVFCMRIVVLKSIDTLDVDLPRLLSKLCCCPLESKAARPAHTSHVFTPLCSLIR